MDAVRYRAILAYDGTNYHGFQRLDGDSPTIQGAVEAAIAKVSQQPVRIIGAGRTDTGVHATGQVIAFDVAWKHQDSDLLRAINATLPIDIALQTLERAEPGFHPRYDASSRSYRYLVYEAQVRQPMLARMAWWVHPPVDDVLDVMTMDKAARVLIGEHDFASFGSPPEGENTRREIFKSAWATDLYRDNTRMLVYNIEATAFLYHMVRTIVGTLVEVGLGRLTVVEFIEAFQAKDRSRIYRIAPPHGLTLTEVKYGLAGRRPPEK